MSWEIRITNEAKKDYRKFDSSIRKQILAGIYKVSAAPLPRPDGYGKPLVNKGGNNLTGFFKIKYRDIGIRVVYTLDIENHLMNIVVISERNDNQCYEMAVKMYEKYGKEIFRDISSISGAFLTEKI